MKKYLLSGGTLLGASAILSKILSLFRDRLLAQYFTLDKVDIVFAAFRIPDFFFYLLVGGVISVVFVPRLKDLNKKEEYEFFSAFLWKVLVFFGLLSLVGVFFAKQLVAIITAGFDIQTQFEIVKISRILFGSVFLLALSGVFSAFLQAKQKFFSLALAPIFYSGTIVLGLLIFRENLGIQIVGYSALVGAGLHFLINVGSFFLLNGKVFLTWKKPAKIWKGITRDVFYRILNNASFQINQTIDVFIASFLLTGSVMAFSIGSNLGHFLLSIVGFSIANSAFPKLVNVKYNWQKQRKIVWKCMKWNLFFTLPAMIFCAIFSREILDLFFNMNTDALRMTNIVFFWTVLSLPFATMIPIFSRNFLANDISHTPLIINTISLFIGSAVAAYLSLYYLPKENSILGLAIGNVVVNLLSFLLFGFFLWRKK